jgi:aconitate hydratase
MGVLPLQFKPGEGRQSFGLTGHEVFDIAGIEQGLAPGQTLSVTTDTGKQFQVTSRIDTPIEIEYYKHGGILPYVLRLLLR